MDRESAEMKTHRKTLVLLVMARDRRLPLLEALEGFGIEVLTACNCKEARGVLQNRLPVQVVLTDLSLDDGGWWTLREEVVQANPAAQLIVCLPRADGGVSDILENGGSDVLIPPYEREEIQRRVEAAAARSYMRSQARAG